jgi:acetyl/propionyl-CoA carboxylase alpha subunit
VEEAPSPFVDADMRKKMGDAAVKAVTTLKYEGVGTIEFLVDKQRTSTLWK